MMVIRSGEEPTTFVWSPFTDDLDLKNQVLNESNVVPRYIHCYGLGWTEDEEFNRS
jgi:hypothetical protein